MSYLLLGSSIVLNTIQSFFTKQYNIKARSFGLPWYVTFTSLSALLFFVAASGFRLSFRPECLPYSIGFALSYASMIYTSTYALRTGQISPCVLVLSYSTIVPVLYGVIFLHEPVSIAAYIGIVFLLISLLLINIKKENTKISLAWVLCLVICFVGNGMCATVQKMQQLHFNGAYKSEFMIAALAMVCILSFAAGIGSRGNKKEMIKDCFPYAPLLGIAQGGLNLFVMIMSGLLPNAVIFPTLSAGGIVLTFVMVTAIYREKLSKPQLLGYLTGIVSIVLINI